ncbi:protein yellow [Anthonomus grandis grandis]|uniref:protein yellow n=1 Tax=Anthonomus grandis grandis TaxID=2921223 RepID=UPI0021654834|nr:protein yellow [Anthonomus grandis grandis]
MFYMLIIFVLVFGRISSLATPEEVFEWKELTFAWPNDQAKQSAINEGNYIAENNLPLGLDRWRNKLFVTVPRWKSGVAATLGYLPLDEPINKSASIIPYPHWKANLLPKGDKATEDTHIISVFRISIDACDRLWVMDSALADILGEPKVYSNPAILIYDLNTDKLIKKYLLKQEDLKQDSFLANIIVDVPKGECDNAYAYIPDLGGYGVVVYSLKENDSWRLKHNFFHFDPLHGDFNVGGVNFQWTDGVFGLALGKPDENGYRTVYFHPLASLNEFSVNSAILRNKTLVNDPHIYYEFKLEGTKGEKSQTSASVFDEKSSTVFLTQLNRDGIACWNTERELTPENVPVVIQDSERLVFTNDIKIDTERNLWILSDKMPQFLFRQLDPNEINYRILKAKVDDIIKGTKCEA